MRGVFVHHQRRPWGPNMLTWAQDDHEVCASPSVAVIQPGDVHTTQEVGAGLSQLVDVFCPPRLDFARLGRNVEAFEFLIEIHYHHYLYYANMLVATALAYTCHRAAGPLLPLRWTDLGILVLAGIFFATSRDTLRKYQIRTQQLLGPRQARPRGRAA